MYKLIIEGGHNLKGNINVSGSKNAALTIMPVCLLTSDNLNIFNIPNITDTSAMIRLLLTIGIDIKLSKIKNETDICLNFKADNITNLVAPYDIVSQFRASILVLGPMLTRFGKAKISFPGGCTIGNRPIDIHLKAFEDLGATIEIEDGYVLASAPNGLVGNTINFRELSVGATENTLMAATLAKGKTIMKNAAIEPEIIALGEALIKMGAKISGLGTHVIEVDGVDELHGADIIIPPDRIEAATYAVLSVATGSEITLTGVTKDDFTGVTDVFDKMGIQINTKEKKTTFSLVNDVLSPVNIITKTYPGFPTDLQGQMSSLLSVVPGESTISETIFENRFMHVPELCRMGANMYVENNAVKITGVKHLSGASVMSTDLRASLSLVIAGLMAKGSTEINRIYHLDRGYSSLENKLELCGAKIRRIIV